MFYRKKDGDKNSAKKSKYNNKKIVNEFGTWDSKKEFKRWLVLKEAEVQGMITDLQRQVKYELIPAVREKYIKHLKTKDKECERTLQLPITYTCDFQYTKNGETIVEDIKASPKSAALDKVFLVKEKLFRWRYGFAIKRVYNAEENL